MSRDFFLYIRSDDLAPARGFYTELLGLEQIWGRSRSGWATGAMWSTMSIDHPVGYREG